MNKNKFLKLNNIDKFIKTRLNFKKLSLSGFIKNGIKNFKAKSAEDKRTDLRLIMGWGMPMLFVPALRFMQDKDKPKSLRKELFIRDFASYSVGTALYALAIIVGRKVILPKIQPKVSINTIKLLPEFIATGSFCIWSGIFGPKFSKRFNPKLDVSLNKKPKMEPINEKNINFTRRLQSYKPLVVNTQLYSKFKI